MKMAGEPWHVPTKFIWVHSWNGYRWFWAFLRTGYVNLEEQNMRNADQLFQVDHATEYDQIFFTYKWISFLCSSCLLSTFSIVASAVWWSFWLVFKLQFVKFSLQKPYITWSWRWFHLSRWPRRPRKIMKELSPLHQTWTFSKGVAWPQALVGAILQVFIPCYIWLSISKLSFCFHAP